MTENGTILYDDELFQSLVLNFQMSAMIGMGKLVNPVTQKAVRNLDEAKISIDMLAMLANKTKGNLSDEEDRLLQQTLTELRLNYVSERSQPEPVEEKDEKAEEKEEIEKSNNIEEKAEADKTKKSKKK